ncbi:MAG: lytic transglycosylase domain-containing protein [Fimbriimonas ginsengisoli]|uniref:Lytic transglycosylase domain-containing protein n=1 Tax=Fimbriimonas ginsengisoli TaxID=1005039 RepID=A0A931LVH0_FIMGI|nr:lytic transglycosylase domain-containing protein [Fimbriimonas ginsengisoli]
MHEIQARMDQVLGRQDEASFTPPKAGFTPLNPYGPGMNVTPTQSSRELRALIDHSAEQANVDPALLDAVVAAESAYDPNARSRSGALGLAQLMPDTARGLGVGNPFDPAQSLAGGAHYLRQLLDRFGDVPLAVAAYNAGPGAVAKHGGVPPYAETRAYVDKVLRLYEARKNS